MASLSWPWANFSPEEMGCNHCGAIYYWPEFMDRLQAMRSDVGKAFHILSAHRCAVHNALVGGEPLSQHLRLAVDISTIGHDRLALLLAARRAGFTGYGFANSFLHLDIGRKRHWFYGKRSEQLWLPLLA